jgi:hypothetical protein
MVEVSKRRALRLLCLHGYNTSKEVLDYQSRQFREVFDTIIDFKSIDAPHDVPDDPPQSLTIRGFKTPFKSWMKIGDWRKNDETGELEHHAQDVAYGLEESIRYVMDEMKHHGPYDGFLTFS